MKSIDDFIKEKPKQDHGEPRQENSKLLYTIFYWV